MGFCIRPVIETWGESVDYSVDIEHEQAMEVIDAIANVNEDFDGVLHNDYNDVEVAWIKDGKGFLDALEKATEASFVEALEGISFFEDVETLERQKDLFRNMKAMADDWRKMIDPVDGSLRFYVD